MEDKILLALDQSSKVSGWAVFRNGMLEDYGKFSFSSTDVPTRLIQIKKATQDIINSKNINCVALEEIQMQRNVTNNVVTFKTLAFVMATILILCTEQKLPYEIIPSATWKSVCEVKGKARTEQKQNAQKFVKEEFGITAIQDICDAICIGYCASKEDRDKCTWN